MSDPLIAQALGIGDVTASALTQKLDYAERTCGQSSRRHSHSRQALAFAERRALRAGLDAHKDADRLADIDDPDVLRAFSEWCCALAIVFLREPALEPQRKSYLPLYMRHDPVGEVLAEALAAEDRAIKVERDNTARELLSFARKQPELRHVDLPRARAMVDRYGPDAVFSTVRKHLATVRRAA